MRLLYLSPVPWRSFEQRPHKFVRWFQKKYDASVVWVEPYPSRFPALQDMARLMPKARLGNTSAAQPDWLEVIKLPHLAVEPLLGAAGLHRQLWRSFIGEQTAMARVQRTALVLGKPSELALLCVKELGAAYSLYDAMDDFPSFHRGWAQTAMRARELDLINAVPGLICSSSRLKDKFAELGADAKLVRNGLDAALMSELGSRPKRGAAVRARVFGYVGTMATWFDWKWVHLLAQLHPQDVVRLIGPLHSPIGSELPRNVEILPPCGHVQALGHMASFDVGLIPFLRNELTQCVDPIKYYEYRALGLPVMGTNFGEMGLHAKYSGVFLCDTDVAQLQVASAAALAHEDSASWIEQFRRDNSWSLRFDTIPGSWGSGLDL